MLGKPSRKTRKHLEKKGRTAKATVVEIASGGLTVGSGGEPGGAPLTDREIVLKTRIRVEPGDSASFEVEEKFRFAKGGEPKAGDEIEVIYDPDDQDKVMLAEVVVPEAEVGASLAGTGLGSGRVLSKDEQAANMGEAQKWLDAFGQGGAMPGQGDAVDKLEKLSKLRDSGALSDAEFEAEKKKLLE